MFIWIVKGALSSLTVLAASGNYCNSPAEMTFTSCEENAHMVKALKNCMDRLDKAAKLRGLSNLAATNESAKNAQAKQSGRLNEANQAQKITLTNINLMIDDVKRAMKDVDGYFDEIVLPEDAEMGEGEMWNGLNLTEMSNHDCYTETLFAADDAYTKLEEDLASLEKAKAALEQMEKVTSAREAGLDNGTSSLTAPPEDGRLGTSGAGPKGKNIRKSDISGTEDKKNKASVPVKK